ncbi:MAG: alpha/beta hydrolase, partial [Novosphingobium sp.]
MLERLVARVQHVSAESGQKVILLGWSLGGVYAREVAKLTPNTVRLVVTLFSPFSGNPRANNAWRVYELISGQQIDQLTSQFDLYAKPPVHTIAVWSDKDGIVAPSCSRGLEGQSDQRVYVPSTHFGFGRNANAILTWASPTALQL